MQTEHVPFLMDVDFDKHTRLVAFKQIITTNFLIYSWQKSELQSFADVVNNLKIYVNRRNAEQPSRLIYACLFLLEYQSCFIHINA